MASVGNQDLMSTICGSKDYIAPEIVSEEPYDSACDCWSLGVIIYVILSGNVPFYRENETDRFEAIKNCEWDFEDEIWDEVSDLAKDLIRKLLIRDPSKRLTSHEIAEHEWFDEYA